MTTIQIVVLAVVQGLTEFLPISSSGHLVLVPSAAGWTDQGLAFDVAVHFGSLLAVCLFFRDDIFALFRGAKYLMQSDFQTLEGRMAVALGIGTVPAAVAGLALAGWIEANLRSPSVIVFTLSGYAIIMVLADRFGRRDRIVADVTLRDALIIGCAQALALVPGTSRSGVTISAGRLLGFDRHDAARFSFLLSVPVILVALNVRLLASEPFLRWEYGRSGFPSAPGLTDAERLSWKQSCHATRRVWRLIQPRPLRPPACGRGGS